MSGRLSGQVWKSNLPRGLKPLAATLADFADDNGENIYPSVELIAWRLSASKRFVQYGLSELRALDVLRVVENGKGGRTLTVEYRMIEANLPVRPPWHPKAKGAKHASFQRGQSAIQGGKERNPKQKRVQTSAHDPSGTAIEAPEAAPLRSCQDAKSKPSLAVENAERQFKMELKAITDKKSISEISGPLNLLSAELHAGIFRKNISNVFYDLRRQPFPEQLRACVNEATTSLMLNRAGKMMHVDEAELVKLALRKLQPGVASLESIQDFTQRRCQVMTSVVRCVTEAATELLIARGRLACA
jgi:hypothetical protein